MCARQRLPDDPFGCDLGPEETSGDLSDLCLLVGDRSTARHRRGRTDALQVRSLAGVADPPYEQGDVGALAAAIGVQLVEHEELQPLGGVNEPLALLGPGEDQLEHHVVGEQDVRRVAQDPLALLPLLLAGVAREGHRLLAVPVTEGQELLQLTALAVGQRVHGVDDDCLHAGSARLAEYAVHDGDDVGERLARAGAGGEHVALAAGGHLDGVTLVPVKGECARAPRRPGRA